MKIEILHNSDESFYHAITDALGWADTIYLGVAYASYRAFELFKNQFELFLRNNGKLRALFDIEEFITEKKLIEELATIPGDSECKVFIKSRNLDQKLKGNYHPKFYLFFNNDYYRVIIGSSNFTFGGIKKNIECNLSISSQKDFLFHNVSTYFDELWASEFSINILNHGSLLDAYQNAFNRNVKATETKNRKLLKLRKEIEIKADDIIKTKREVLNEEFAYLLGLMSANSKFNRKKRMLTIDLFRGVANRGKDYEGFYYNPDISEYKISQYTAHKKDVDKIIENLSLLIKQLNTKDTLSKNHIGEYHFQVEIEFDENSVIYKEILNLDVQISRGKVIPFVPKNILESRDEKIISSFIKGYCDLKSRISISDGIYDKKSGIYSLLRMGISLPHGDGELLKKFKNLFKNIGLEKGVSVTDPSKRSRENLIRVDVRYVPLEIVGTHWRRIFLSDFVTYMKSKNKK